MRLIKHCGFVVVFNYKIIKCDASSVQWTVCFVLFQQNIDWIVPNTFGIFFWEERGKSPYKPFLNGFKLRKPLLHGTYETVFKVNLSLLNLQDREKRCKQPHPYVFQVKISPISFFSSLWNWVTNIRFISNYLLKYYWS